MNNIDKTNYQIGEICLMKFEGTGSEQTGIRPAVIFQNNKGNIHSPKHGVVRKSNLYF